MTTKRLYRDDPYLACFEATCLEVAPTGDGLAIVLDRTAFYPGGGGQPADLGRLGGMDVVGFEERADGTIVHRVVPVPVPSASCLVPGSPVTGNIDAARRLDLMRQHTGQHLLSAAIREALKAETVSVHFAEATADTCSLDVGRGALSDRDLARAEDEAWRVLLEDRPVSAAIHALEDAPKLGLRKAPPAADLVAGEGLRVVTIEGYDVSACCGTHVRRTGEVGPIRILGQEKVRGQARLRFACGPRTLAHDRSRAGEQAAALERAQAARREAEKRAEALEAALGSRIAEAWAAEAARSTDAATPFVRVLSADDPRPEAIANGLIARGLRCVLARPEADGTAVLLARPEAPAGASVSDLGKRLTGPLGGKGGGRPHFARFAVPKAAASGPALDALLARLAEGLRA